MAPWSKIVTAALSIRLPRRKSVSINVLLWRITLDRCGRIRGRQIFPVIPVERGAKTLSLRAAWKAAWGARHAGKGVTCVENKGFSTGLKMRRRSTIAFGHVSAAKILLIPTKERTLLPHVEADKSASDTRPAS